MVEVLNQETILKIGGQAAKVRRLAERRGGLELDRLREETAALQALIAEAARVERLASQWQATDEHEDGALSRTYRRSSRRG